jgi:hypothetical protein
MSGNKESDWFEGLFASHPPSQERVDANRNAIAKNDSYFYYPLRRGLIAENQGKDAIARRDLETSARLLPTGVAAYALGNIASRANDLDSARKYYTAASEAGGEVGKAAQQALAQLDARQNPGQ